MKLEFFVAMQLGFETLSSKILKQKSVECGDWVRQPDFVTQQIVMDEPVCVETSYNNIRRNLDGAIIFLKCCW